MQRNMIVLMALFLLSGTAQAAQPDLTIRNLPDSGNITLSGMVDKIGTGKSFALRDASGIIEVEMPPSHPNIRVGQNVIVSGTINSHLWGILGKDITASKIEVP